MKTMRGKLFFKGNSVTILDKYYAYILHILCELTEINEKKTRQNSLVQYTGISIKIK